MPDYDFDIGILGGGAAGLTVASGAAQLGARTLLIEKEDNLGGDCLHFGCVPSKTLIRSAHVYHLMKRHKDLGLPKVDIPPVDFSKVAARIQSVINTIQAHDSEERFCSLGAKVEFGEPGFIDSHSIDLGAGTFSARNWVIATGSSAGIPDIPGLEGSTFITNRELFSLKSLPESMIILGAGPVAVEMAQAFCRLGTVVTVVQRSGQILSREDKDMADLVMETLSSEGVKFYLNSRVVSAEDKGNARIVRIDTSEGKEVLIKAEALLVALGRKANIEGLNLEAIGVECDEKGISTDARMKTSRKHIYAAGDVTGRYQFTHAAGYEGGIVLSNALFRLPRKADYTFLPWCTYTEPELSSIGMNEKAAKAAGIDFKLYIEEFKDNDRGLAEGEGAGRIKMLLDSREKPIGIQIAGPHAGELLSEWVAVLNGRVKLSTLASAVHPYPTLGEINKRVAGTYFSPRIFSDTVKKGLKFFFHLKGRACTPI